MIEKQIKEKFGSWTSLAEFNEQNPSNFKRKIIQTIDRLNKWLNPAGIEIQMVLQKPSSVGKKQ